MKVERKTSLVASSMVLATALASSCVDHVDTQIKSCPCASGYVCCESGVCAAESAGCDAATSALSATVEGSWSGYIENLSVRPDVPDSLRITLGVAGDGTLSGRVAFAGNAPPPATDPDHLWPPNYDILLDSSFLPGTSYAARQVKWLSRRLKFSLDFNEAWQPWCALQQSYPLASGDFMPTSVTPGDTYWCNPGMIVDDIPDAAGNCSISLPSGKREVTNCDRYWMCSRMCQCEAGGCHAKREQTNDVDIAFDGPKADGSISFGINYNLRLTREPR